MARKTKTKKTKKAATRQGKEEPAQKSKEPAQAPLSPKSRRSGSPGISSRKSAASGAPPLRINSRAPSDGILSFVESNEPVLVLSNQQRKSSKLKPEKKATKIRATADIRHDTTETRVRYYVGSGLPSGLRSGLPAGF